MENNNYLEKRIFLGARYTTILGFTADVETATTGDVLSLNYEESNQKETNRIQREGCIKVLMQLMDEVDTENITHPTQVYMVKDLYKVISNQTYKYWTMLGCYSDGTELDENELNLWDEFADKIDKVGRYFIFKDLYDANFQGRAKFNQEDVAFNKFYYDWIIDELDKIAPVPATPKTSASRRRNRNMQVGNSQAV